MLGCIMCTQSLLEAMLKFVAKRNSKPHKKDVADLINVLGIEGVLSAGAVEAALLAWRHRNDFHHLNIGIKSIELNEKARECVEAICAVEDDIFGATFDKGALVPNKPIYWDITPDGRVPVFVRNLDI